MDIPKQLHLLACRALCLLFFSAQAQLPDSSTAFVTKTSTTRYRQLSMGFTRECFRDFATSPLFYVGTGVYLHFAWIKQTPRVERSFNVAGVYARPRASIPKSAYIQPTTKSTYVPFNFSYQRLYAVKLLGNPAYTTQLGAELVMTQHIRVNNNLGNSGIGLENISNLMVSGQLRKDVSRKREKKLNLFVLKTTLRPVKRNIRVQMNVGVLNLNYRPGYAYVYMAELRDDQSGGLGWLLSGYKWSLNGLRFQTLVEYSKSLPNGNATSITYRWEAARAPGRFDAFEMASHRVSFSFYFNANRK